MDQLDEKLKFSARLFASFTQAFRFASHFEIFIILDEQVELSLSNNSYIEQFLSSSSYWGIESLNSSKFIHYFANLVLKQNNTKYSKSD